MTRRWTSLYGRWHLRQAALVWVPMRLLVTVALVMVLPEAGLPVTAETLTGIEAGTVVVAMLTAAMWFDRTSRNLRVLLANLGFTSGELLLSTAAVGASLESLLAVIATR